MLTDAGPHVEFEAVDIEKYWQGRVFLEAGRLQDVDSKDAPCGVYSVDTIKPYMEQAQAIVQSKRELHTEGEDLPEVDFGGGNTMSPYFVIVFCLMFEAEGLISAQTRNSLTKLTQAQRDKKIRIHVACHHSALGERLLKELEDALVDKVTRQPMRMLDLNGFDFDGVPVQKQTYKPNQHLRQGKVGRYSGNQRFNAKPQRQNFKGRGR